MMLILQLFLAHILGDFVFQSEKWVKNKEKKKYKSPYLYWHIVIHFLTLITALKFDFSYWLGILIILIAHYFIDLIKLYINKRVNNIVTFLFDQILHLSVLIVVSSLYISIDWERLGILYTKNMLLLINAVICVTLVSSIVIDVFLSQVEIKRKRKDKVGSYIGLLERLLVFIFIITNNWEAIGFLLAAKSVFRFGELSKLKEEKEKIQYYFIGTLLSFGLAILIGLAYNYFINVV